MERPTERPTAILDGEKDIMDLIGEEVDDPFPETWDDEEKEEG